MTSDGVIFLWVRRVLPSLSSIQMVSDRLFKGIRIVLTFGFGKRKGRLKITGFQLMKNLCAKFLLQWFIERPDGVLRVVRFLDHRNFGLMAVSLQCKFYCKFFHTGFCISTVLEFEGQGFFPLGFGYLPQEIGKRLWLIGVDAESKVKISDPSIC